MFVAPLEYNTLLCSQPNIIRIGRWCKMSVVYFVSYTNGLCTSYTHGPIVFVFVGYCSKKTQYKLVSRQPRWVIKFRTRDLEIFFFFFPKTISNWRIRNFHSSAVPITTTASLCRGVQCNVLHAYTYMYNIIILVDELCNNRNP